MADLDYKSSVDGISTPGAAWGGGSQITADVFNHIDIGIDNASKAINNLQSIVDSHTSDINTIKQNTTSVEDNTEFIRLQTAVGQLSNKVDSIEDIQDDHTTAILKYNDIENEVIAAHRYNEEVPGPDGITTDSLNSRFNAIENRLNDIDGSSSGTLTQQVTNLSNEITEAHTSSVIQQPGESENDPPVNAVYDSLDERFEAVETLAKAASLTSTQALIEKASAADVAALQTIVSHPAEGSDKGGLTERLSLLETSIGNNDVNSLSGRVGTLEATVNNTTTGLAATKAIADAAAVASEVTAALGNKQGKITASGILKGDGNGNISAATPGSDFLTSQDISGLDERLDKIDGGEAISATDGTLAERVSALESNPVSATVVIGKNFITYNNDGIPTNIGQEINDDKDYLLQGTDNKYYYWKYINGSWSLISGAGNNEDLTDDIKKYNVIKYTNDEDVSYLYFLEYDYGYDNTLDDTLARPYTEWEANTEYEINSYVLYNNYIYQCIIANLDAEWIPSKWNNLHIKMLNSIELPQGGSGISSMITISNLIRPTTINNGKDAIFSFTATTNDGSDITSTKWYVDGIEIQPGQGVDITPSNGQGVSGSVFSFNAKGYLKESNESTVRVSMKSDTGATLTRSWPVQSNEFSINWANTIQPIMLYTTNENVNALINVAAASNTTNIVEVKVNNEYTKTETVNGSNNISLALNASWFTQGKNVVTAIMKNANNEEETTDEIKFIVLWAYNTTTPLVAFAESTVQSKQYEEALINYYAYDPSNETATVVLTFSDGTVRTSNVGREMQTYRYISNITGTYLATLLMTYVVEQQEQTITDTLTIVVNSSAYNLAAVGGDSRVYNFDPNGHNNTDTDKELFANLTFSNNFDWVNGGFQQDVNGSTAFVVKKGNTITLPRTLFSEDDSNGKTIDICFKIANSDTYDAQAVSDIDNNASPKGLILKANHGELYLNNSEPQIFKYCEENRIDMSILIEGSVNQRLVTVWLDGIPSYAGSYTSDMLKQTSATNTIIGSQNCDIWIYGIRVYNQTLSENNMIQNYIANGVNTTDKIKRYIESDIYSGITDRVTNQQGNVEYYSHRRITPSKLHAAMPNLTIVEIEADSMTKTKENPVPGHITITDRVQVKEGNVISYRDQVIDLSAATTGTSKDGCIFKVQGTSSVAYARSALNIDIDFKNCIDAQSNKIKYKISNNSIGVSYINIKANVASSENANNVCAVDWYNTYQPFLIEARKNNSSIRDSIEAKPCAVFFTNTGNNAIWLGSQKVEPGQQTLYFMGDLCNSKKNLEVFGEDGEGTHYTKCCIEDSGNDTLEQRFLQAPVFNSAKNQWDTYDGVDDNGKAKYIKHFEWRMEPNVADKDACIEAWTQTATWVVSTANDSTKFKNEFNQYFNVESMLYHFLMIEYFAAYDNVSKNTFYSFDWDENADQTKWNGYRWTINKAYDWDTILAYDNDGKPLGDYGIDFGDIENGKSYFNAVTNPIWLNIQAEYKTELNALYSRLRGEGAWNSNAIIQKWNNYQAARPHAAMVRDAYVKYIYPYKTTGVIIDTDELGYDNSYIGRLAGSKIYQRNQYLTYQTSYMDGKYGYYNQNSALQFRTNGAEGTKDFTVKSYAKTYMTLIKDGQSLGSKKVEKGAEVIFQNASVGNNTTMYLTPDRLVQYIRPLNETQNSTFVAAGANKLTEVVLGGDDVNRSWLTTSNIVIPSPILKVIDLHNVETFVSALDLRANTELTTIDTRNTGTGIITIAPYAPLTSVHLNACSGISLIHINTITMPQNFTIASGNNLSYIRMEDCNYNVIQTIIDCLEQAIAQHDAAEMSIRLIGLHGETENSSLQLSSVSLLEELAKAKAIDAYGNIGTVPCVLTGKVHVPELGSVQQATFRKIWPLLDISYDGDLLQEWTVSFVNDDNKPLKDSNGNNYIQIIRNNGSAHNPLTNNEISIPVKQADAQYTYTFSGWDNLTGAVTSNKTVRARYTSTINSYTVTWYDEPNGLIVKSYTANYGTDISTYDQPEELNTFDRVKVTNNGIVKVFTGWDKPVGKLTSNLNIYAQWETSNINDNTTTLNMSTLKAADLYALSRVLPETKDRLLESKLGQDPVYIQMGRDFNYTSNINTYNLLNSASKLVFDGTEENVKIYNGSNNNANIRPLSINSDWTLAIDYKFFLTSTYINAGNEFVLASCYQKYGDSIQGFKLSLVKSNISNATVHNVQITWGNNTQVIDHISINPSTTSNGLYCSSYRNMVVLRHIASDPTKLFLYFYAPTNSGYDSSNCNNIGTILTAKTDFQWDNYSTINVPLILGGNYNGNTENLESDTRGRTLAQGVIYWAKYWDKDLGVKNCTALAQWTHEKIPFIICGSNHNHTSGNSVKNRQILENTNLNFAALTSISDRNFYPPLGLIDNTDGNDYFKSSWKYSYARNICNNRFYKGLSVPYQSIIQTTSIYSVEMDSSNVISNVNTQDYFYLPAECEVNLSQQGEMPQVKLDEVSRSWYGPWSWLNSANATVITYDNQSGSLVDSEGNASVYLYRFVGNYISPSTRIFQITTNPYNNGDTWTYHNTQITVEAGDVWINGGIAYIYISKEALDEGEMVDLVTINPTTNMVVGGWRKASIWPLRTYNLTAESISNEVQFEKVLDNGQLLQTVSNSTYRSVGVILCPEFSL